MALVVAAPAAAAGRRRCRSPSVDTTDFPVVHVTVRTDSVGKTPDFRLTENGVPANNAVMVGSRRSAAAIALADRPVAEHDAAASCRTPSTRPRPFVAGPEADHVRSACTASATRSTRARRSAPTAPRSTRPSTSSGLATAPGTALYDAVKQASEALAATPAQQRVIVLLTDGASRSRRRHARPGRRGRPEGGRRRVPDRHRARIRAATAAAASRSPRTPAARSTSPPTRRPSPDVYNAINDQLAQHLLADLPQPPPERGRRSTLKVTADGFSPATTTVKAPGTYVPPSTDRAASLARRGAGARLALGRAGRAARPAGVAGADVGQAGV